MLLKRDVRSAPSPEGPSWLANFLAHKLVVGVRTARSSHASVAGWRAETASLRMEDRAQNA
jgi:hypothetical protein